MNWVSNTIFAWSKFLIQFSCQWASKRSVNILFFLMIKFFIDSNWLIIWIFNNVSKTNQKFDLNLFLSLSISQRNWIQKTISLLEKSNNCRTDSLISLENISSSYLHLLIWIMIFLIFTFFRLLSDTIFSSLYQKIAQYFLTNLKEKFKSSINM
jgi:hypothetical protein